MIRKHFAGFAASALALAVSVQAFAGTVTTDGADIVVKTKGGLEVATTDKQFSFKIGGRLQADYSTFDGFYTQNGDNADAAYFRRAFLGNRWCSLRRLEVTSSTMTSPTTPAAAKTATLTRRPSSIRVSTRSTSRWVVSIPISVWKKPPVPSG